MEHDFLPSPTALRPEIGSDRMEPLFPHQFGRKIFDNYKRRPPRVFKENSASPRRPFISIFSFLTRNF